MPRGRSASTLAQLERRLAQLNTDRQRVIAAIRSAVDRLTSASTAGTATLRKRVVRAAKVARPRSRFSAAARKRLSQLAKERWAKARKAGKKRLG
jgi:hypothetical protein